MLRVPSTGLTVVFAVTFVVRAERKRVRNSLFSTVITSVRMVGTPPPLENDNTRNQKK